MLLKTGYHKYFTVSKGDRVCQPTLIFSRKHQSTLFLVSTLFNKYKMFVHEDGIHIFSFDPHTKPHFADEKTLIDQVSYFPSIP